MIILNKIKQTVTNCRLQNFCKIFFAQSKAHLVASTNSSSYVSPMLWDTVIRLNLSKEINLKMKQPKTAYGAKSCREKL